MKIITTIVILIILFFGGYLVRERLNSMTREISSLSEYINLSTKGDYEAFKDLTPEAKKLLLEQLATK